MNIVDGSIITVKEPVFGGSYRKPKYLGDRTYKALVLNESYGNSTQHTFSLKIINAEGVNAEELLKLGKTTRKGRNIYPNLLDCVLPADYEKLAAEKAERRSLNNEMKALKSGVYR